MTAEEWPLVGRGESLRTTVQIALRRERAGIVVTGPAGVGRTRFARAALAAIGEVGLVPERADRPAWYPVWVMASRATRAIPLGAMSHLLPALDPGDGSPGWLLHQARQVLLREKGAGRLLLGVDDVHLLDETTAVLLHQLASSGDAFLVLTTPTGIAVPDPVFALWKEGLVERIDLAELTRRESDDLVADVLGGHVESSTLARLWSLSLGNPLFLEELVRGARTTGALRTIGRVWHSERPIPVSSRLIEILQQRTDGSAPMEQSLMRLLAFGEPLGSDLAAELTSPATVAALEDRGVIVSRRTGRRVEVSLAHPLHAEVLRRSATPYQERDHYQRLADALEARGVRREADRWRLLAWRVAQGAWCDPDELLGAAAGASASDPSLAERLLREAAASGDPDARLQHARVLVRLGRASDAECVLSALDQVALSPEQRVSAAVVRSYNQYWGLRDAAGALATIAAVADHDPLASDSTCPSVFGLLLEGRYADAAAVVAPVVDEPAADEPPLPALAIAATAALRDGRTDLARHHANRARDLKAEDPTGGWVRLELAWAEWCADLDDGRLDDAEAAAAREHAAAIAEGRGTGVSFHTAWLGIVAARRGRLRTAARWLFEAAAGVTADRFVLTVPLVSELVIALAGLGQNARARSVFAEAGDLAVEGPVPGWSGAARVWLAGIVGQTSEAERIALQVDDEATARGPRLEALHAAARLGITGDVTDRLVAVAEDSPSPVARLYADHARALVARDGAGLDDVAERFASCGLVLLAAECAAQAAVTHRAAGAPGSAGGSASRARAWAELCEGASTPSLERLDGVADLTRREMEIASLAASGLTSKAIASQLVVSVRTVDNILRMVYAKLGVSGRGDLSQVSGIRASR